MTQRLNDLLPLSPDLNAERLAALKRLLPDIFTNEGKLNIEELKKVVDPAVISEGERYDFRWYGKTRSKREAFTPSKAALVYDPKRSVNADKANGNLIIEGENLEVLKLLTSAYREKIKCIYIDPPYNTGKDFVYCDDYSEGRKPYWEQTGVTENGVKVDSNSDADGRYHSNWLSMIHARLLVARYLLKPDGVIFVSIDDREFANLWRVMADIYGEENFLATFVRRRRMATGMGESPVSPDHEYIIAFAHDKEQVKIQGFVRKEEDFPFEDAVSKYRSTDLTVGMTREMRPNQYYPIKSPRGTQYLPPEDRIWRFEPTTMGGEIAADNIIWPDSSVDSRMTRPRFKTRFMPADDVFNPVSTWIANGDNAHATSIGWSAALNAEATRELRELFDAQLLEYPKPSSLIRTLVYLVAGPGDTVLDFFAGSGTTAQSVLDLNSEEGQHGRRFILVQIPELTEIDSDAFRAGYKRISEITIERVKRVIARYQEECSDTLSNDPKRQFAESLGFKVYTLEKSAFPRVEFCPDPEKTEAENVEVLKAYIRDKEATFHVRWDRERILDEVLLKNGFTLSYTLEKQADFAGNEVFLAKDAFKEALICLDYALAAETVDHFKKHKDRFFICLEMALDTTKKWNLKHSLGDKFKAI